MSSAGGTGKELELWAVYGVVIGETLIGGPRRGQPRAGVDEAGSICVRDGRKTQLQDEKKGRG